MKYICDHIPFGEKTSQFFFVCSDCTFGIYLFENVWREQTMFVFDRLETSMGTFNACLVHILVACLVGGCATFIWKKCKAKVPSLVQNQIMAGRLQHAGKE